MRIGPEGIINFRVAINQDQADQDLHFQMHPNALSFRHLPAVAGSVSYLVC